MRIFIDADGCPVVDITVRLSREAGITCFLLCDTAHELHKDGAETYVFDKGADSVDFAIVNRVRPGDLVITQDYGLASMCLARSARVIHQDGWEYTPDNMDALLFSRHASRKYRAAGGRTKGPSRRAAAQDVAFEACLKRLLQNKSQG